MNTENEGDLNRISQVPQPSSDASPKKKRRWLVYLLIGLGSIFVLGLIAIVAIATYYHSLIKTYTATTPKPLPAIEISKDKAQDLTKRWQTFCDNVFKKQATEPFRLTDNDINQMIGNFQNATKNLRIEITNDVILAHIMFPLDNTRKKELKGRYLNATVNLKLQLEDGFLTLRVKSATANDKPVPKWIVNRISKRNLLQDLERNYDFSQLLQELDDVIVKDGQILFIPLNQGK
jgi:hypothetical protein